LHIYVLGPNHCGGIFFKSLSYPYEVGCTHFTPIFGVFAIFDRNFTKIVTPPSDEYQNSSALLKGHAFLKRNDENSIKIDP